MPPSKQEKAQKALAQLFESLLIQRIICVDDVYALEFGLEEAIGVIEVLDPRVARGIIKNNDIRLGQDRDIWVGPFRAWWESLEEDRRKNLLQDLYNAHAKTASANDAIAKSGQDWRSASSLSELFTGQEFLELSFTQWKAKKDEYLKEAGTKKTLFLFDEDLSNDGGSDTGGRQLIREVLGSPEAKTAMCGLLSHNIPAEREFDIWKDFNSDEYNFDGNRVVPVSKNNLGSNPLKFARAIKLTVLNPDCHELAKLSIEVMRKSHRAAKARLEDINIYLFDHIVFRASDREGIWEPDTLFRLINLFQRLEARTAAMKSRKLRHLAEKIRSVSGIPTEMDAETKPDDAWKIQRLELYETGDFINTSLLPIELGDVFEKVIDNDEEPGQYILLAQPCDLMVRTKEGSRKGKTDQVVLARIAQKVTSGRENEYFTLPHYMSGEDKDAYVLFTETYFVSLKTLDLCAFNREGIARIKLSDKSGHLVTAWRKHHEAVLDYYRNLIDNRKRIGKLITDFNEGKEPGMQIREEVLDLLNVESSRQTLFSAEVNAAARAVTFNCKRIARLEPNHAGAMWTKYCNYMSRPAFNVDLGK